VSNDFDRHDDRAFIALYEACSAIYELHEGARKRAVCFGRMLRDSFRDISGIPPAKVQQ